MGPWSDGFDDGFGPLLASGLSAALLKYLGIIDKKQENIIMESMILTGSGASNTWSGSPMLAMEVRSIEIDIPLDEVGTTDPSVTLSGSLTGAYTFHSDTDVKIRFKPNEDVYVTTENFTSEYSAVINYLQVGDMGPYMQTDTTRTQARFVPNFWRYR